MNYLQQIEQEFRAVLEEYGCIRLDLGPDERVPYEVIEFFKAKLVESYKNGMQAKRKPASGQFANSKTKTPR